MSINLSRLFVNAARTERVFERGSLQVDSVLAHHGFVCVVLYLVGRKLPVLCSITIVNF